MHAALFGRAFRQAQTSANDAPLPALLGYPRQLSDELDETLQHAVPPVDLRINERFAQHLFAYRAPRGAIDITGGHGEMALRLRDAREAVPWDRPLALFLAKFEQIRLIASIDGNSGRT